MCSWRIIWWQHRRHTWMSISALRSAKKEGKMVIHNGEYSHHDWAISVGISEEFLDERAIADLSWSKPYCRIGIFGKES